MGPAIVKEVVQRLLLDLKMISERLGVTNRRRQYLMEILGATGRAPRYFNKIWKLEELLEADKTVHLIVVYVDYSKNFCCHIAVAFFAIIIVENFSKKLLRLKMLNSIVVVVIILLKNDFNILESLLSVPRFTLLESLLVLVEHVSHHQFCQEEKTNEHKNHEQERVKKVCVHGWQENVRPVRSHKHSSYV